MKVSDQTEKNGKVPRRSIGVGVQFLQELLTKIAVDRQVNTSLGRPGSIAPGCRVTADPLYWFQMGRRPRHKSASTLRQGESRNPSPVPGTYASQTAQAIQLKRLLNCWESVWSLGRFHGRVTALRRRASACLVSLSAISSSLKVGFFGWDAVSEEASTFELMLPIRGKLANVVSYSLACCGRIAGPSEIAL